MKSDTFSDSRFGGQTTDCRLAIEQAKHGNQSPRSGSFEESALLAEISWMLQLKQSIGLRHKARVVSGLILLRFAFQGQVTRSLELP